MSAGLRSTNSKRDCQGLLLRAFILLLSVLVFTGADDHIAARAQGLVGVTSSEPAASKPIDVDTLEPEGVDRLLGGLTDAEIRALLREELIKDADARAAEADADMGALERFEMRVTQMAETITRRADGWQKAIRNISDRLPQVEERLAAAKGGGSGMLIAALTVAVVGVGAALLTGWLTSSWRAALHRIGPDPTYWDRVLRTLALAVLEILPVVAFVGLTRLIAPQLTESLGPLVAYIWIYHAGVSSGWFIIVISRRIFAPDAPAIRIAPLSDDAVAALHSRLRAAVIIGVGGWLVAGLSPTLDFGFAPAMVTVWLSGTVVAGLVIWSVFHNRHAIREACLAFLTSSEGELHVTRRLFAQAVPALFMIYLGGAYLYWAAHWLERGQQELHGPVGTLFVLLIIPALDQVGRELARSVTGQSERARRYAEVIHRAWRIILGIAALALISRLWGSPLHTLVYGPEAIGWINILWTVAITLLVAHLIWGMIVATFRRKARMTGGDAEDPDTSAVEEASRLDTLIPLFRTLLMAAVITVTAMILLSSLGLDIGPLLASAGIIGIAVGFGAQTLVRDIFSGMFFLIDDAFRVGEYIELDQELRGEVEAISIRSLQLRHHRGPVVTVPFGELKSVTNHNRDWVIYKMNFRMEPNTDPQLVKKIVKRVGAELMEHPDHGPKFIEPLKSQGVLMIDDDSALVIRVKFKCRPRAQFVLRREIYHALQKAFAENGVHLARRKVEVVATGPDGEEKPVTEKTAAAVAEQLQ